MSAANEVMIEVTQVCKWTILVYSLKWESWKKFWDVFGIFQDEVKSGELHNYIFQRRELH